MRNVLFPFVATFFSLMPAGNAQQPTIHWNSTSPNGGSTTLRVMTPISADVVEIAPPFTSSKFTIDPNNPNSITVKTPKPSDSLGVYPLTREICYYLASQGLLPGTPGVYAPNSEDKTAQALVRSWATDLTRLNGGNKFAQKTEISWTFDSKNRIVFSVSQPAVAPVAYVFAPSGPQTLSMGRYNIVFNPDSTMTLPVGKIKKGTIRVDRGDNFFKLVRIVTAYQNPTIPPQVFFPQAWASPYQYSDQYAAVIHLVDETEARMRDKNTFKKTDVDGAPVLYPGDLVKF